MLYEISKSLEFLSFIFFFQAEDGIRDGKSTRLNSSHLGISYAVFCLKKNHSLFEVVSAVLQLLAGVVLNLEAMGITVGRGHLEDAQRAARTHLRAAATLLA